MTIEDPKSIAKPAARTRSIRGAVLEAVGAGRPYAETRPIRVENLELEGPGKGAILVRIEAAGYATPTFSVVNGNRPRPVPMLLGHEAAGILEEPGEGVSDISVGQRVVMTFLPRCGQCAGCHSNGRDGAAGALGAGYRRHRFSGNLMTTASLIRVLLHARGRPSSSPPSPTRLLTGGQWQDASDGGTFDVHDPAARLVPATLPPCRAFVPVTRQKTRPVRVNGWRRRTTRTSAR